MTNRADRAQRLATPVDRRRCGIAGRRTSWGAWRGTAASCLAAVVAAAGCGAARAAEDRTDLPPAILLWPPEHPANQGPGPVLEGDLEWVAGVPSRPALYAYLPPRERANGGAVLVCPGGGYAGQAFRKEGIEAADWFCARGVAAFVLLYRSGPPASRAPGPWEDAQRAIRLIRSRAAEWRVDPAKTGVVGFSAGGHLASSLATRFAAADAAAADPLERFSSRPDFAVLVYPVISLRYATHAGSRLNLLGPAPSEEAVRTWSTDEQVTADTPPTFLVHASDDASVLPQNSLLFYQALLQRRVPAALHVYERGGHGFGMLRGDAPQDRWPELLEPWLRARGVVR